MQTSQAPPPRPKNPPPMEGPLSGRQDLQREGNASSSSTFTSPSLSAVRHAEVEGDESLDRASAAHNPRLRLSQAYYGAGTVLVDVTATLQRMVDEAGGLDLKAFGYKGLKPNGCMNRLLGDPAPGRDKQLLFSYEIVGCCPHLITTPEDKKLVLTMEHIYWKVIGSPPPDEARLVSVEIIKATYGRGNDVYDVTTTLRSILAEQGGHGLTAFGYTIKPNGGMNKAFGDPCPGEDKTLAVEYRWRTALMAHAVDEDKKVSLCFEKMRPLL